RLNTKTKIISIGSPASDDTIELQLVPYSITRKKSPDGAMNISEFVLENSDYINNPDAYLGLSLAHNGRKEILPLSRRPIGFGKVMKLQPLQFVKSNSDILNFLGNADVSDLWSMTVFSEKEDFIVQALSIIQEVKRITVLGERRRKDKVLVQTPTQNRVPLKSMGDGMNRIFTIALAMVNAENGFLLVDEFDNGLHYSVQENLWKVVFFLAEKLNIQVFATTHSLDCLYAFANTCNSDEYRGLGKAIRLERHDEALFSEVFSDEDLRKVVKHGVEIR
ncbi:MAG: AAA family ATPase, partial [Candidatus Kapabacteria bacterium]|nr:AAA family ATPase [Candidatus Kapabacteria bacterium]